MLKMIDVFSGSPRSFATDPNSDITMIKATQGTGYINPYCDVDYQAAKKAGKLLGVYHYCGGGNARDEAEYFYQNIKGYLGEAVLAVDWESAQNQSFGSNTYVSDFVDRLHELTGVYPLIYVSQSAISQVANCADRCGLWVAWYDYMGSHDWMFKPYNFSIAPWQYYTAWQFSGYDQDKSWVNVTKENWLKLAKSNDNSAKPEQQPAPQPSSPEAPQSKTWVDALGDTWHEEHGKFTNTVALNLRWGAKTTSALIMTLPVGSVIKYDAWSRHDGYVWIRQPRSEGQYAYIVVRDATTGRAFGKFE